MLELWVFAVLVLLISSTIKIAVHSTSLVQGLIFCKKREINKRNMFGLNGFEDPETWPRVSIIKPIVVDDPKVKSLIETFFQIDYPKYDIHFCFQSNSNSCINFVNQLAKQYPKVKVFVHSRPLPTNFGNRKIMNATQAFSTVRGELIWIADENIYAVVTSLKEMVTQFDEKDVACVHQVFLPDAIGIICISGMSMMFDKEKLEEIGGIKSFDKFLAEDYALSHALIHRGYKIKVVPSPAIQDPCHFSNDKMDKTSVQHSFLLNAPGTFISTITVLYNIFMELKLSNSISIYIPVYNFYDRRIYNRSNSYEFVENGKLYFSKYLTFPESGPLPNLKNRIQAFFLMQFFIYPYIYIMSLLNITKISWHNISYTISRNSIISIPDDFEYKKDSVRMTRFKRFKELQTPAQ
ncbi:hypothetical protein MXB_1196 [Myxobolus squamalis]|nr:hypothetical protein MXB_1196 [Myxobolus squamalis]